jgi:hypothetical protein
MDAEVYVMQFPITRYQLVEAIEAYGFQAADAERIVSDLEGEGRIDLSGSMLAVNNPTDPDAPLLTGLCERARGGDAGRASTYKIREFLQGVKQRASKHGRSRRH